MNASAEEAAAVLYMYIERKRICEMENRSNGSSENYKGGRGKRRRPTHARTRGQTGEAREGIENGAGEGEDGARSKTKCSEQPRHLREGGEPGDAIKQNRQRTRGEGTKRNERDGKQLRRASAEGETRLGTKNIAGTQKKGAGPVKKRTREQ